MRAQTIAGVLPYYFFNPCFRILLAWDGVQDVALSQKKTRAIFWGFNQIYPAGEIGYVKCETLVRVEWVLACWPCGILAKLT